MDTSLIIAIITLVAGGSGFAYFIKELKTIKSSQLKAQYEATSAGANADKDKIDAAFYRHKSALDIREIENEVLEKSLKTQDEFIEEINKKNTLNLGQMQMIHMLRERLSETTYNLEYEKRENVKNKKEIKRLWEKVEEHCSRLKLFSGLICVRKNCKQRNKGNL